MDVAGPLCNDRELPRLPVNTPPKAHIIVLENDDSVQSRTCELLRRCSFRVTAVDSINAVREALATEHVDLLVLDLDDLQEITSLRSLARIIGDLPCVMISEAWMLSTAEDDGCDVQFLRKPYRMDQLLDAVAAAIMATQQRRHFA